MTRTPTELAISEVTEDRVAPLDETITAPEEDSRSLLAPALWHYRGVALMVADASVIVACFLVAFYLRCMLLPAAARFLPRRFVLKDITLDQVGLYLNGALLLAAAWVLLIWRDGGYESGLRGMASPIVRIRSVLIAGAKAFAVLMVISYMYRGALLSRPVYLMTGLLAFGTLILVRLLFRALDRDLAAQGMALQTVLIAGLDAQAEDFARRLERAGSTVKLVGFAAANGPSMTQRFAEHPVLGRLDEIQDIYARQPFDKLILSQSVIAGTQDQRETASLIETVNFCEARNITLYTLPHVLSVAVAQNEVGTFSGVPLVRLRDASLHKGYAVIKRIEDLILASGVLVLGSWLWLLIALLIRLTSKGPAIFTQTRVGLHGRPFKIYKFRSMVRDAEARLKQLVDIEKLDVPGFKLKGDPRVTWIGRILRRTSLDEIPQFLNVLKGEMSVIGPRPEMPELVNRYDPWQRRRLKAKPGITGYQQVMVRGMPLAAAIEYDLIYLKHQGLLLDLYIILKTVFVVLRGRGITH